MIRKRKKKNKRPSKITMPPISPRLSLNHLLLISTKSAPKRKRKLPRLPLRPRKKKKKLKLMKRNKKLRLKLKKNSSKAQLLKPKRPSKQIKKLRRNKSKSLRKLMFLRPSNLIFFLRSNKLLRLRQTRKSQERSGLATCQMKSKMEKNSAKTDRVTSYKFMKSLMSLNPNLHPIAPLIEPFINGLIN